MVIWFGFSKTREFSFVSWLIMRFTRARFSHAYIKFQDEHGAFQVFHSVGHGTEVVPYMTFIKHKEPVNEFREEIISQDYFRGFISGAMGKSYPKMQLVGCALAIVLGLKKTVFDNGKSEAMCSETAFYVAQECIKGWTCNENPDLMTPKRLHAILHARWKERLCG